MERPSHIAFSNAHIARRLPLFALAAFLQVGAILLIMTGLGHYVPIPPGVLTFTPDFKQPTIDKIPPPEPQVPKHLVVEPRPIVDNFNIDRGPGGISVNPKPTDQPQTPKPPTLPDQAAVGITATHTIPPYPTIAIRQGVEGTVLLRLTVLETGRVARAEVVTGSGNDALDRAAQAWIVAHWAYKPALNQGQAVASQAMASVTFNLKNAR
jgi:periplasmic protein TonB